MLWAAAPEELPRIFGWVLRENSGVIGGISGRPRRRYSALRGRYPLPHVVWTPRASRRSCCCVIGLEKGVSIRKGKSVGVRRLCLAVRIDRGAEGWMETGMLVDGWLRSEAVDCDRADFNHQIAIGGDG